MAKCFYISAVLLAFLIASCGGNNPSSVQRLSCNGLSSNSFIIPGTPNITSRTTYCEDYFFTPEKLSRALHIYVDEFANTFDIEPPQVWSALRNLEIEVSVMPRISKYAFDKQGNLLQNVNVTGLAFSPKKIWVEVKTSQISSSSLSHELTHAIIWHENMGIHGDPDHEGKEFSGWTREHTQMIKRVNNKLLDASI